MIKRFSFLILTPKQKEIDLEAENRLDDFWKSQLNKQKSKGKLSKILQAALDEKRREEIKNRYIKFKKPLNKIL